METKDKRVKFLARLRKSESSNTSDHTWKGRHYEGQYRNRKDGMRLYSLSTSHFADPDDTDKFLDTSILLSLGHEERENPNRLKNS